MDINIQNKRFLIGGAIALAVVIIAMLVYNFSNQRNQQDQNQEKLGEKQTAPKGELTPGFPKELVQSNTTNIESYTIPYDGQKQYTANFTTDKSIAEVAKGYSDYFDKNGFVGVKQSVVNPQTTTLFAIKGNANYSVVINKASATTQTFITVNVLQR